MKKIIKSLYHIAYWIIVVLVLTLVFGRSWGNNTAAFFFISMLLPIVLGDFLLFQLCSCAKVLAKKKYVRFALYSLYTAIVSLYFVMIVLMFSFIYLGNFNFIIWVLMLLIQFYWRLYYICWYLLGLLLMVRQIKENRLVIQQLLAEKIKWKNRFWKLCPIEKWQKYHTSDIVYIESLSDYIRVNTIKEQIVSKEKISNLATQVARYFYKNSPFIHH
jgi:two-component system, LytTR family, response regulator LytT